MERRRFYGWQRSYLRSDPKALMVDVNFSLRKKRLWFYFLYGFCKGEIGWLLGQLKNSF